MLALGVGDGRVEREVGPNRQVAEGERGCVGFGGGGGGGGGGGEGGRLTWWIKLLKLRSSFQEIKPFIP